MNDEEKKGVFVGAVIPDDTASKLVLASVASSGGDLKQSKSDIIRASLHDYLSRMKPNPVNRMVSHLLARWHSSRTSSTRVPFTKYCESARDDMIRKGVSDSLADEVCERLRESIPAQAQ